MTELKYKHELMALMRGLRWKVQAHEDMIENFIPDLSFGAHRTDGWIEVKYVEKLPDSLGAIKHYTRGQQDWLINRGMYGSGHCYLLVGSPSQHFVWRWSGLRDARDMPWAAAAAMAMTEDTPGDLIRALDHVVRAGRSY